MGFLDWLYGTTDLDAPSAPGPEFGPEWDARERDLPDGALHPVDANKDGLPDAIAGVCVSIDYLDATGATSSRRVLISKVYREASYIYVYGFCLLRQEQRTFRADRIQVLRLPPQWRAVSNPVSFLMTYLPGAKEDTNGEMGSLIEDAKRDARLYDVRKAANHGLRVLAFVARSDGSIADAERSVVCDFVRGAAALVGEELDRDDCEDVASDIETLFPTKRQVANSLDAIRLYREQSDIFLESLKKLVRADGIVNAREQNAMQMLVEILQRQKERDENRRS